MPTIEATDEQIEMHNRLIDLCKALVNAELSERDEIIARIKSIVYGKHITESGLYWRGMNMMP